jgi:hypothetical protein
VENFVWVVQVKLLPTGQLTKTCINSALVNVPVRYAK